MTYHHPLILIVLLGTVIAVSNGNIKTCRSSANMTSSDIDRNIKHCRQEFQRELNSFENEISSLRISKKGSSASDVEKGLRQINVSVRKVFTLQYWYGLEVRSNLPYIKSYIKCKVNQLYQLYLGTIVKLFGNTGQLLRIAYAGCKDSKCVEYVRQLMYEYQDVVIHIARVGKYFVNTAIRALRYHRYAYYFATIETSAEKSLKLYNRTLNLANTIAKECTKVVSKIQTIRDMSMSAFDNATTEYGWSEEKKNKYKKIIRHYTRFAEKLSSGAYDLRKQGRELSLLVAKLKAKTDKLEVVLEARKVYLTKYCESNTTIKFEEVCRFSIFWFGRNAIACTSDIVKSMTEEDCRKAIESAVVKKRQKRLLKLSKYQRRIQKKQLEYERNKASYQKKQMEQFMHLKQIVKLMDRLQPKTTDKQLLFAIVPLYLATKSMIIIDTQLSRVTQFWIGVLEDKTELVENSNRGIFYENVHKDFKDVLLKSGFAWIAFSKVLRTAATEMRPTVNTVDDAFMRLPSSTEIERVIRYEATAIIREVKGLYKQYLKRRGEIARTIKKLKSD